MSRGCLRRDFLFVAQTGFHRLLESFEGGVAIGSFGHDAHDGAAFGSELQQRNQALAVGDSICVADVDLGGESFCNRDKGRGRAGMKAVAAAYDHLDSFWEVGKLLSCRGCGGCSPWSLPGESSDDIGGVGGGGEPLDGLGVAEDIGKVGQDRQVFIGSGGNAHHQLDGLAGVPLNALGHLHHRDVGAANEVAMFGQTVGDGDAVAKVCVGDLFPRQHTVDIAILNGVAFDQQRTDCPDGCSLVGDTGPDSNIAVVELDHVALLLGF